MKKTTVNTISVITSAIALYILVFQGFGFPNISPLSDFILRILAALCVQIFVVCNFKKPWIRIVPLAAAALLALWGGYLYIASDPWQDATFPSYFAEFCSPFLGCCAAGLIHKINFIRN